MQKEVFLSIALTAACSLNAAAVDDLSSALVWAQAKGGKAGFELTPGAGKWEERSQRGWLVGGAYDAWNEISFELCAKDDGRFFVGLSAPHNVRRLYPEIAWADISIEGAGAQENLDFAKGFQSWGANTPAEPRIATVGGKRAMIVRSDRGKYRALDLKAGQKVAVRAAFRVMGPAETPKDQHPLDLSLAVNGPVPEGVKLPAAKRDFIGIAIDTVDPAAHGGNSCVLFRNGTIRSGAKSVRLAAAKAEPCRYLYLLVSSSYTKGPELADVRIAYADGAAETQTLVRKTHLDDWSKAFDGESCKTVWTELGENGDRSLNLVRLVLDERKAAGEVEVTTAEKGNFVLYGATLTSADWKPVRTENVVFRLGGEWRKPDMPSREIVAGSAIDLSGQLDFAPCGTYGKVIQKGDRLVFEKRPDKPLRFMGNHSSQVWVCDWEPDERRYCDQMQRTGCNAIRLSIHRLIGDLWFTKEERARKYRMTDGFFVDSRMDNFCRFVAEFNRRGIYLLLASQGQFVEIEALMAGDAKARENYRQFMVRTLNYRNPHTGNLIKDEPCVMGWQFANEQSVQHVAHICAQVPNPDAPGSFAASETGVNGYWARKTREAVAPKWKAFLKRKYGDDWEAHKTYPKRYTEKTGAALDFQLFSQELMDDMMAFYRKVADEAGWTGLTSWGNYDKIMRTTETRVKNGMATEVNNYHSFLADDGHGPQVSSAGDGMSTFRDMAGAAIPGKTVFITEFNDCQHNRYCHEMGLAAGAIASLQGWDAFFLHNSTVLTDLLSPYEYFAINDGLVIANHPSMRASTFLMACLYGRGDAATSPHTVKLDYTKAFMRALSSTSYPDPQQLRTVMLCRTRVDWPEYGATPDCKADLSFPGFGNDSAGTYEFLLAQSSDSKAHTAVLETMVAKMREKGVLGAGNRTDVKKGVYESDTGEILIESAVPRMRVVTARTEALTLPENGAYRADCLEVVRTRRNATFGAVAVDGKPLSESGRIVIVMDGESAIDGSVKTSDRVRYVDWGPCGKNKRPLQEKIWRTNAARLRLRNTAGGEFELYPLSVNGIRREPLPVTREGDALVFTLDTSAAVLPHGITPFFELVSLGTLASSGRALPPLPVAEPKYLPGPDLKVPVARQLNGGVTTGIKRICLSAEVSRPNGSVSAVVCPDLSHGRMPWLRPGEGRFASLEFRLRSADPKKAGRLADAVKLTLEPAGEPGVALVRYALDLAVAADMMPEKDGGRPVPVFDCRWSMPLDTPKIDFVAGRADMTVYPGDEHRELKVELPASVARAARIQAIRPAGRKGCEHLAWTVSPTAGESEGCLRIDLGNGRALAREVKPSYGPVDFDDVDALHVPVRPTRNLLANGGFEQGLKGWKMLSPCGVDLNGYAKAVENGGRCYEEIVDGAKFGRKCCHFKPVAPGTRGDQFSSPAQSVFPDRDYVLSFWAKSDGNSGARLRSSVQCPRRFRNEYGRVSPAQGAKSVSHHLTGTALSTSEWRRFETAFRCTNGVVEVVFDGKGVFLDGVMLEEGVKATETADDPVVAHLVTASPENDLAFGRPFDARLELVAGAAVSGSLRVSVENYYRETVFEKAVDLGAVLKRRDAASPWAGEVPLDFDPARIGQGVFVVRYDFAADGKRWSDYERFAVTDFLDNAHPTAFFFLQYPYFQTHGSTGPRLAQWMATRGIGSTSWPRNDDRRSSPLKELYDTGKFRSGVHTLEHDLKYRYPKRFAIGTPGISAFTSNVTDEVVAFVEKEAYLSGSVCEPDDSRWALSNEEEAGLTLLRDKADFKSYARLQAACARGLRKAFAERGLKLLYAPTHGMCSYNPPGTQQCGKPADRRWSFERMLEEAGAIGLRYDFISMHMYGAVDGTVMMRGANDRGENAAHLFATLRRYGYDDVPVRFEEGFNLLPFKVPSWGADGWADKFYSTPPSQAYGHTEFLHAGVIARQYLMDLSHWPRVETSHVWQHRPVMDFALTPWMWTKVSNTIGSLLPDPQGVAEAKPFPKTRAYVYRPDRTSKDGRGVLAIWTNDPDVENGVARSPTVTLDLPADAAFVDLMGNRRARPADGRIPLTPAPLFVLSANVYDLCRAIGR